MANLEEISINQRQKLWLDIAERALQGWGLQSRQLRILGQGGHVVIKVEADDGGVYVLRLCPAARVNASWLRSELQWLSAIRRHTDLLAPNPLPALKDGREQLILELLHDRLPPPQKVYAALFQFIHGETRSARELQPDDVYRVGEYLGLLHTEAQFKPPPDFERPRLDWAGLFGDASPYAAPAESAWPVIAQRDIVGRVARQLRRPLAELSERGDALGLIHGDLLAKNIIFRGNSIAALDFEYCGWGYFLYDLAPLLWQLKGDRPNDYAALEDAFWRGYAAIRPAAESDRGFLAPFIAARQAASIRWLMANYHNPPIRAIAPKLIAERCEELKVFLETGILRRSTPTL